MRVGSGNGRGMSLATERKPFDNGNKRANGGEQGDNRTIDEMRIFLTQCNETADKRLFGVAQRCQNEVAQKCQNEKATGGARNGETERIVQFRFIG